MTSLLIALFVAFMVIGVPVAHALLLGGGLAVTFGGNLPLSLLAQRVFSPTQSFPLLAIPFFILAGNLMMAGRFGTYLVDFAKLIVGRMRGGLGQVSVLGSLMFGGVSGSAVADATAIGNALIPVQKQEGYPAGFAAAINASSATASVLIPPSIPLIIYGLVAEVSIVKLFIAGIMPAILLALTLFALIYLQAIFRGLPASPLAGGLRGFARDLLWALPALLMPVFVVGTLRFGIATPTEVSVMAVAYAILIKLAVYRDFTFASAYRAVIAAGVMTGAVVLIIMATGLAQWILALENVPASVASWALDTLGSPWAVILSMIVLMLAVGTFVDLPAAILLLTPIFVEIAAVIDLNPVHLGVMMVLTLSIGLYTPPVGTTLFISTAIAKNRVGDTVRELLPFYAASVAVTVLVAYVPALSVGLL